MSTEKKFIFTAQDGGVVQKANQIYSGIAAKSKEYANTLKEQTSYIEKQIKELEKKARLEQKEGGVILKQQESLAASSKNRIDRNKYQERADRVRNELSESSAVLDTLKEILNETKRQTNSAEKTEKDYTKKLKLEEDRFQAQKSLWRQEVQYDKSGVRKRIKTAEKNDYKDMPPEQVEKLMYQKTISGGGDKEKGIFGQVFAGTLAAGIVQKIGSTLGTIASSQTGEQAINSLLGSLPFIGDFLGKGSQRSFEEKYAVGSGLNKLKARTGNRNLDVNGNTDIGYSTRENLETAENLITASGNAGGYNKYGNQARLMERGLGLSSQTITQIVKDIRTTQSTSDITKIAADIIRANPELRRDQTKFLEILNQTSQLTNQLASQTEKNNLTTNAGIVGQLRSIGGSFADPVLGSQRMMSINQSLTNPSNDFQKSRSFGVLSGLKPGSSYFQLQEMQEKGLGQKGYLEGIISQLEKETGGGENLMLAAQQNLGLGYSTSRKLIEARQKNPNLLKNFAGGNEDIDKLLGGSITGRAKDFTAKKDIEAAEMSDKYLNSTFSGLSEGVKQTTKEILKASTDFSMSMNGLAQDISNSIRKSLGLNPGGSIKTNIVKDY